MVMWQWNKCRILLSNKNKILKKLAVKVTHIMYFCWALRNDFAEFDLVYQETVSSNALSDRSIPFLQMKKKNQGLIICCTSFCHLQNHKNVQDKVTKVWGPLTPFWRKKWQLPSQQDVKFSALLPRSTDWIGQAARDTATQRQILKESVKFHWLNAVF